MDGWTKRGSGVARDQKTAVTYKVIQSFGQTLMLTDSSLSSFLSYELLLLISENFPFYSYLVFFYLIAIQKLKETANMSWGTRIYKGARVENTQPKLREQAGLSVSESCVPGSKIESIGQGVTMCTSTRAALVGS